MGDLTNNFSRWEFACKGKKCCGGSAPINMDLVNGLQELSDKISDHVGHRVVLNISRGFSCITHNEDVQKEYNKDYVPFSSESQHPLATAADVFCPPEITVETFYVLAKQVDCFKNGGIGLYSNRLHLDVRGVKARW